MVISRWYSWTQNHWPKVILLAGLLSMGGVAIAQEANFDPLSLSDEDTTATANGTTTGIYALSNIASRDRRSHVCMGFADATPDHIMTLEDSFSRLTVQVNSGGNDTALLIQGPDNSTIRCGQDISRRNPDAKVDDIDWAAGTYRIWVGSHHQGQRYNYSLKVAP